MLLWVVAEVRFGFGLLDKTTTTHISFIKWNTSFWKFMWGSLPHWISLKRMQLPFSKRGFGFPDLGFHHQTWLLTWSLTCPNYRDCSLQLDFSSWVILETSCLIPLSKWNVLGSAYSRVDPIPSAISTAREIWCIMSQQYQFDPFSPAGLTLAAITHTG